MTFKGRVRLASALWLVLGVLVWNVIFDRVIVLAGRRYVYDAALSARRSGVYLPIDAEMRPAIRRAAWLASIASLPIALGGIVAVQLAARRYRRKTSSKNPSARGSLD